MNRRSFLMASGVAALGSPLMAAAQNHPNIVVWSGFPAGGLGDQISRPLIEQLRGNYPQALIFDAKPGAGGRIAASFVKRSAPDGNNLLQCPAGVLTLHPHVFTNLGYEPLKDFVPVSALCNFTYVMTAGPGLPSEITTVEQYLKWAAANPKLANYGIPSRGNALHMAGMLLSKHSGVAMEPIPFKGGGPLLTNLLGGQVPVSFNVISEVLPHIRSGKLRALAVTSPERWQALADTPTLRELGYKDIAFTEWLGWFAPVDTPRAKLEGLNAAVQAQMARPEMQQVLEKNALQRMMGSVEALQTRVRDDYSYWKDVVAFTGFTPEE